MPRYDLSEFLEDGAVVLEGIRGTKHPDGKEYTFPSPPFEVGLRLARMFDLVAKAQAGVTLSEADTEELVLDDTAEKDLYKLVMGSTLDELKADGVPWTSVQKVFQLLLRQHATGQDINAQLASLGEAQARPNRAARRATPKKTAGGRSRRASGASARPTQTADSPASSTSPTEPEDEAAAV